MKTPVIPGLSAAEVVRRLRTLDLVDAAGDLLVGTADNTVGRLPKGTGFQRLRANSGATTLEWGDAPCCRVTNSAAQTITTATSTALTFNTETWDPDGMHSTVTNTSRITIPAGWPTKRYLSSGELLWVGNGTGERYLWLAKNGTKFAQFALPASAATGPQMQVVDIVELAAGDYVELFCYHTKGSNLDSQVDSGAAPKLWLLMVA